MHLQIKMDQKSFSLRRLVLKEKCSSFSSIQKPLMVECGRVKTSPTALVYTHTTTQARINRRKVFVEPMLAVQRVNGQNNVKYQLSLVNLSQITKQINCISLTGCTVYLEQFTVYSKQIILKDCTEIGEALQFTCDSLSIQFNGSQNLDWLS
ncbi:Hypothetical_protein [Hexamita inflata]|uniref:Hypothetical_protein n=1 Tax=Hexamita inflata TaxID=28002 RepID=A0AA86UKK7_9EUKA|nr:Hypothetical protein HINF_LOCUS30768 [Hexamita inflata]